MKNLRIFMLLAAISVFPLIAMNNDNVIVVPVPEEEIKIIFHNCNLPQEIQNYIFLYLITHMHGESDKIEDFITRFKIISSLNKIFNESLKNQLTFNQMIDNAQQKLKNKICYPQHYYAKTIAMRIGNEQAKQYIKIHEDLFSDDLETVQNALDSGANPHYKINHSVQYPLIYHATYGNASIVSLLLKSEKMNIHKNSFLAYDAIDAAIRSSHQNANDIITLLLPYQSEGPLLINIIQNSRHNKFDHVINNLKTIHKNDLCSITQQILAAAAYRNSETMLQNNDYLKKVCEPKFQHDKKIIDALKLDAQRAELRAQEVYAILDQCNTYSTQ